MRKNNDLYNESNSVQNSNDTYLSSLTVTQNYELTSATTSHDEKVQTLTLFKQNCHSVPFLETSVYKTYIKIKTNE